MVMIEVDIVVFYLTFIVITIVCTDNEHAKEEKSCYH